MYYSFSNNFGPNMFGDHFVLKFVLGTLEMHWMLVSFIRKVLSPYEIFGDKLRRSCGQVDLVMLVMKFLLKP